MHRVQDWGLNLGETLRIQGAPDGRNNSRAHPQVLHLFRVNQQIGGAAAQACLRVGEGVERDGMQALGGHLPVSGQHRDGAVT